MKNIKLKKDNTHWSSICTCKDGRSELWNKNWHGNANDIELSLWWMQTWISTQIAIANNRSGTFKALTLIYFSHFSLILLQFSRSRAVIRSIVNGKLIQFAFISLGWCLDWKYI